MQITRANSDDAARVAMFCQPIYMEVYPNKKYGIGKEQFSTAVFRSADTQRYFREVLENSNTQVAYLAEEEGHIIGTISLAEREKFYEIRCYYIRKNRRNQGVGKLLFDKAMEFRTKNQPVKALVGETNKLAWSFYEKLGFNQTGEVVMYHWPEWPEGISNGYVLFEKNN